MMFSVDEARTLLQAADVFFDVEEDEDPHGILKQTLNMNDVWAWACADGEYVPNEELPRVAELFWRYGWCGLLYWVSEKSDGYRSEFCDVNRFVQFVRAEESIRKEEPSSSKRAYLEHQYTIGGPPF